MLETSMMLHCHPDLVRLDLIPQDGPADFPPDDLCPPEPAWVPPSGVPSSAKAATTEEGGWMVEELTDRIAATVRKESG